MAPVLSHDAHRVLCLLERLGVLLVQDAKLPSLVSEVVGAPLAGSYWSHPESHAIFRVLNELAEHRDVALVKLVNKKRTLLHRALFAPLVTIGSAREPWQLDGLPKNAIDLLARVDRGELVRASGEGVKRLELALLVASQEQHAESGAHHVFLGSWSSFAEQRGVRTKQLGAAAAKAQLEQSVAKLAGTGTAQAKLPWR